MPRGDRQEEPPGDRQVRPPGDRHAEPAGIHHGDDRHASGTGDRHAEPAGIHHGEPAGDRHASGTGDRHGEPADDRHGEPAGIRHGEPAGIRHAEPAGDRHAPGASGRHAEPAGIRHAEPAGDRHAPGANGRHAGPASGRHAEPTGNRISESESAAVALPANGYATSLEAQAGAEGSLRAGITERAAIGDQLRIPIAWCEMGSCISHHADPAALGEADIRARAISADWRIDALGRLACPGCQQSSPGFWVSRPVALWDRDTAIAGAFLMTAVARNGGTQVYTPVARPPQRAGGQQWQHTYHA